MVVRYDSKNYTLVGLITLDDIIEEIFGEMKVFPYFLISWKIYSFIHWNEIWQKLSGMKIFAMNLYESNLIWHEIWQVWQRYDKRTCTIW